MTVTVGVKCFNNVRYIREALESAFRQTYRPLEIVVCDDCSTDGSWETIREVVEARSRRVERAQPGQPRQLGAHLRTGDGGFCRKVRRRRCERAG